MSRFCTSCGRELPEGCAFCTNCGEPVRTQENRRQYRREGWSGAPVHPTEPAPPRRGNGLLYGIIAALSVLLIAAIAVIASGVLAPDRDDGDDRAERRERTEASASPAPEESAAPEESPEPEESPAPEEKTAEAAAKPVLTAEEKSEIADRMDGFYEAFISDVNNGQYSSLYAYVQHGSLMESQLKDFMVGCAERDQWEKLLHYEITAYQKLNENTCLVTAVERYDVMQNVEPTYWWIDQQCVYRVCRQSNGSWMLVEYAEDIVALDQGEY